MGWPCRGAQASQQVCTHPALHTNPAQRPCTPAQYTQPSPAHPALHTDPAHQVCTPALNTSLVHQPSPVNQPSPAHPALHTDPAHGPCTPAQPCKPAQSCTPAPPTQPCILSPVHHILNTRSAHQTSHLLCTPDISSRRWYPKRRPRDHPPTLSNTTGHSPRKAPDPGGPRAVTGQTPHPSPCRCSGLGGGQGGVLGIWPSPPNQISTRLCPHQGQAP